MLNFDFLEKGLGTVSGPHFMYDFSRKCFPCYILLTDQISLSDFLSFLRYWAIWVLQLCFPRCDVIDFEINLILSNQAVFLHDQNVQTKINKS